jgi:hypothetical protein
VWYNGVVESDRRDQPMDQQDRIERAIYKRMIEHDEPFFVALFVAVEEELGATVGTASDFGATVELEGRQYDVSAEWLWQRRYPE